MEGWLKKGRDFVPVEGSPHPNHLLVKHSTCYVLKTFQSTKLSDSEFSFFCSESKTSQF
jgi:hypothetical protein